MNGFFHPMRGIPVADPDAARTRAFQGDGTPYLKVPGLKRVEKVRVGTTVLPEEMLAEVVLDHGSMRTARVPLGPGFLLDANDEGQPVLLRHITSCDGSWQKDVPIYVTGDWEPEAAAAPRLLEPVKK